MVGVFLVAGCDHYQKPEDIDCTLILDRDKNMECVYNKSILTGNAGLCRDIMNEKMRDECIDEVAVSLLDHYSCRQHDRMKKRDACQAKVGEAKKRA